jgi:hypothetical protein
MRKTIAEVTEARRIAEDLHESQFEVGSSFLKDVGGNGPWVDIASLSPPRTDPFHPCSSAFIRGGHLHFQEQP